MALSKDPLYFLYEECNWEKATIELEPLISALEEVDKKKSLATSEKGEKE